MSSTKEQRQADIFTTETKYSTATGLPLVSITRLDGQLQATPDGLPSYVLYDAYGRPKLMQWHHKDELHRSDAGAMIYIDPDTNIQTSEGYYTMGKPRDRSLGPHIVHRDRTTGEITKILYAGDEDFQPAIRPNEPP